MAVGEHPPERAQHRSFAPAARLAAALDGAQPLDEPSDHSEQQVRAERSCDEPVHVHMLRRWSGPASCAEGHAAASSACEGGEAALADQGEAGEPDGEGAADLRPGGDE